MGQYRERVKQEAEEHFREKQEEHYREKQEEQAAEKKKNTSNAPSGKKDIFRPYCLKDPERKAVFPPYLIKVSKAKLKVFYPTLNNVPCHFVAFGFK